LLWRTYFANIITGNGIGVCRMLNIQEALSTNKFFGEAGLIGIKRQGKKVRKIPTLDSKFFNFSRDRNYTYPSTNEIKN